MAAYESVNTINVWMGNIPQFGGVYDQNEGYLNQPIEIDAFWFAGQPIV